jgi:hypothetical protein
LLRTLDSLCSSVTPKSTNSLRKAMKQNQDMFIVQKDIWN